MTGAGRDAAPGTPSLAAGHPADPDELALVAAGFPRYHLWRQHLPNGTRYVATARALDVHPHILVTASLDELATDLTATHPAAQ